jgi:hypothetical protein
MLPACHVGKQELVGCHAPAQQAFLSREVSWPDRSLSKNPSDKTREAFFEYDDFSMGKAGPSSVHHDSPSAALPHTINLDESSVTVTQDLPPCSSPMSLLDMQMAMIITAR